MSFAFSSTASISNPFMDFNLKRNPAYSDKGSFFSLSEFLTFANNGSVAGILLNIKVSSVSYSECP